MTQYTGADVALLHVGGYDLRAYGMNYDDEIERVVERSDTFGDTWVEQLSAGLQRAMLKWSGFFDDAALASSAAVKALAGLSKVAMVGLEGATVGVGFIGFKGAMEAKFNRVASRGELHKVNAEFAGDGIVEEGALLTAGAVTITADTNGSTVDNAAATTNGGAVYLEVVNLTLGSASALAVKVQHSTDGSSWSDKQAFTAVTAAPAAERIAITGTVNRYRRYVGTWTGGAGGGSTTKLAVGLYSTN